jgi:hypothetical protein
MSIPLNPQAFASPSSIQNAAQAKLWIDRFARPAMFNSHAWQTTKKLALLVWQCHLENRPFRRTLNFMHPSFYEMIKTPEGICLVNESRLRRNH